MVLTSSGFVGFYIIGFLLLFIIILRFGLHPVDSFVLSLALIYWVTLGLAPLFGGVILDTREYFVKMVLFLMEITPWVLITYVVILIMRLYYLSPPGEEVSAIFPV